LEIVIFIIVIALIIVGAFYSHQQQAARRAALAQFSAERGWRFEPENDASHDSRYAYFSVFAQGHSRYAYNTILGTASIADRAWPLQMGDYHYATTSSNGKKTTTHHHRLSYLIVETPYLGAPDLFIRAEGFLDSIAGFLGFDDIDFESAEFSDRFIVKSSDKRFAYDVLHPRMMEFMLDGGAPTIDFRRGQCCLYRSQKCWTPEEFAATLAWATDFFARWPRHITSTIQAPQ
jgi:hypothetical protein